MAGRQRTWTEDDLRRAVVGAATWSDVARALGLKPGGRAHNAMKQTAERLGLDTCAMKGRSWNRGLGKGKDKEKQLAAGRRWYRKNPQVYAERNERQRQDRKELIRELKNRPCMDCGGVFPWYVMDFDHREGEEKLFNIGNAAHKRVSREKICDEIAKCDVVCSNCHRVRSAQRGGWVDEVDLIGLSQDT